MTARSAFSRAVSTYAGKPGAFLRMTLIEVCLRLIALAPLLLWSLSPIAAVALSAALFLLLVVPARQNAAEACLLAHGGASPVTADLLLGHQWPTKLLRGLATGVRLLFWALPLLAAAGYAYYAWKNVDAFTAANFIIHTLGSGDVIRGVIVLVAIFALLALIAVFGAALHSGDRHALALADTRKAVRGHRGLVLRAWLLGLLTLVPFVVAAAFIASGYFAALKDALTSFNRTFKFTLPKPDENVWKIVAAYVVLRLPLLPLKTLTSAEAVYGAAGEDLK